VRVGKKSWVELRRGISQGRNVCSKNKRRLQLRGKKHSRKKEGGRDTSASIRGGGGRALAPSISTIKGRH